MSVYMTSCFTLNEESLQIANLVERDAITNPNSQKKNTISIGKRKKTIFLRTDIVACPYHDILSQNLNFSKNKIYQNSSLALRKIVSQNHLVKYYIYTKIIYIYKNKLYENKLKLEWPK